MLSPGVFTQVIGKGPNLVLLHGWGVHSVVWKFIAEKLANEFTVTLVDLPGFGRSNSTVDSYDINSITAAILEVVPDQAIWIGWSLGGLIATHVALHYPQRIEKLVAVASTPRFTRDYDWPGMDLKILQQFADQLMQDYEATVFRFLLLQFHGTFGYKTKLQWLEKNLFIYNKPTIEVLLGSLQLLQSIDLRSKIADLQCPTLYLLGRLDALVPSDIASSLTMFNKNIQCMIVPKASHALFLSHEDEFLKMLNMFLAKKEIEIV